MSGPFLLCTQDPSGICPFTSVCQEAATPLAEASLPLLAGAHCFQLPLYLEFLSSGHSSTEFRQALPALPPESLFSQPEVPIYPIYVWWEHLQLHAEGFTAVSVLYGHHSLA